MQYTVDEMIYIYSWNFVSKALCIWKPGLWSERVEVQTCKKKMNGEEVLAVTVVCRSLLGPLYLFISLDVNQQLVQYGVDLFEQFPSRHT